MTMKTLYLKRINNHSKSIVLSFYSNLYKKSCLLRNYSSSSQRTPHEKPSDDRETTSSSDASSSSAKNEYEQQSPEKTLEDSSWKKYKTKLIESAKDFTHDPTTRAEGFIRRWEDGIAQEKQKLEQAETERLKYSEIQENTIKPSSSKINPRLQRLRKVDAFMLENQKQREKLMKEAWARGYFQDYKDIAKGGSKLWDASPQMFPFDKSLMIPNLKATTLSGQQVHLHDLLKNKVSLVTFVSAAYGVPHVQSFLEPFLSNTQLASRVQVIQVNFEERWVKKPFLWMSVPWIRRKIPRHLHSSYLVSFQSIQEQLVDVGMTNRLIGWVNLVDPYMRIRWQANGLAKEHELGSLFEQCGQLDKLSKKIRT